ncbi:PT domain-containing protein, partial [Salmonella enterica]
MAVEATIDPYGYVTVDTAGNIYVSQMLYNKIYKTSTGYPTIQPSRQPTAQPVSSPSGQPSRQPSRQP